MSILSDAKKTPQTLRRRRQGYIMCKILWPGGGEMVPGKKMKNEAVGNKMKRRKKGKGKRGKEKEEKEKGERDFFC